MNKKDVLELLCQASNALMEAEDALSKLKGTYISPDAGHYLHEIQMLLSCDDGEAGFLALVNSVEKDVLKELS